MLIVLCTLTADSARLCAQEADYVLIFSDEFNQPNGSRPDPEKWNQHSRYAGTWSRWITDSKDVCSIRKGCLVLRAIPNKKEPADTAQMFTGAINTKGKFDFKYGRVELRMKSNNRQGNFAAIWMKKTSEFTTKEYGDDHEGAQGAELSF
ncbi:MAG: family 16 glycosylhydrolase [Bacteroidaceae bacterium]|nr:family 16 glycosylhydrolase [Bacteroidaceae bacterium]